MTTSVQITTGCRLHFGPFANLAEQGRKFGGLGVMIEQPGVELIATTAAQDEIVADPPWHDRLAAALRRYRQTAPPGTVPAHYRLELRHAIPGHVGLGSGTQLALAVGRACEVLDGIDSSDPRELARRVGRGNRSALGLYGFHSGGLLVDAGKRQMHAISPVVVRKAFPPHWRFVLITPPDVQGISGEAERQAFAKLPPMPMATTAELCRVALMQILPGLDDEQFDEVSSGLWEFGRIVGDYFAPGQGGRFADRRSSRLVQQLRQRGIEGVGQSSWGPTIFALVEGQSAGEQLAADLACGEWGDCGIRVVSPRNRGAEVTGVG